MIPVDLSANCEGWIYDPHGSEIQILGIRSRYPFSGSTNMSGQEFMTIEKSLGVDFMRLPEGPVRRALNCQECVRRTRER